MEEYASIPEESLTRDTSQPSNFTPVPRIGSVQPIWKYQSSGKELRAAGYFNELTLDDWLDSNGFSVFKQPLADILSITKIDQILMYTKEDVDNFITQCGKDSDIQSKISLHLRSEFKGAFAELIEEYTSFRKRGKSEAFREIDVFVPNANERKLYSQFKLVKEEISKYVATGNVLSKTDLIDKLDIKQEFGAKLTQMSNLIQSKFETLSKEFETVEEECISFWKENDNPFSMYEDDSNEANNRNEENEKMVKKMESKLNDFKILDQFVTEFEAKLNETIDQFTNALTKLFDPSLNNLTKSPKSFGVMHSFDEKSDENSNESKMMQKSNSLFTTAELSGNEQNGKRQRASTALASSKDDLFGDAPNNKVSNQAMQLIFNSNYISMMKQNGTNINCIFQNNVNNNKCDGNRKQRMIVFHFGRNIQKMFKIKVTQMGCKQNKNRKYSFNFGVILVKNFFYDFKKFTNYFETYDQNLSIYSLSNSNANQSGINKVDSKFIYLKCSSIAKKHTCAVYNNDKKETLYESSKLSDKFCISLDDILAIEYDPTTQTIYFKKNDEILSQSKIDENFNKLDAFYGLSSIGCDCSKDGNISFEIC